MEFCPECNQLIVPRKMKDGRYALFCENCDLFLGITSDLKEKESLIKPAQIFEGVVNDENEFADYKHVCKKCGFNKAQIIDMGVFYSDEDNLIFLKCGKCGYSERVGRKTS